MGCKCKGVFQRDFSVCDNEESRTVVPAPPEQCKLNVRCKTDADCGGGSNVACKCKGVFQRDFSVCDNEESRTVVPTPPEQCKLNCGARRMPTAAEARMLPASARGSSRGTSRSVTMRRAELSCLRLQSSASSTCGAR